MFTNFLSYNLFIKFKNFLWSLFFLSLIRYIIGKIFYFFFIIVNYFLIYFNYNESFIATLIIQPIINKNVDEVVFDMQIFLDTMDYPTLINIYNDLTWFFLIPCAHYSLLGAWVFLFIASYFNEAARPENFIGLGPINMDEIELQHNSYTIFAMAATTIGGYFWFHWFCTNFIDFGVSQHFYNCMSDLDFCWLSDLIHSDKSEEEILSEFKTFMKEKLKE